MHSNVRKFLDEGMRQHDFNKGLFFFLVGNSAVSTALIVYLIIK